MKRDNGPSNEGGWAEWKNENAPVGNGNWEPGGDDAGVGEAMPQRREWDGEGEQPDQDWDERRS